MRKDENLMPALFTCSVMRTAGALSSSLGPPLKTSHATRGGSVGFDGDAKTQIRNGCVRVSESVSQVERRRKLCLAALVSSLVEEHAEKAVSLQQERVG